MMALITVKCYVFDSNKTFISEFYEDICIGELIRNCRLINLNYSCISIRITFNIQFILKRSA